MRLTLNVKQLMGKDEHDFLFHLKLKLQSVDLSDACVPLLIDQVHLGLQDPPLALSVPEAV